jgi:hypothetical protein
MQKDSMGGEAATMRVAVEAYRAILLKDGTSKTGTLR